MTQEKVSVSITYIDKEDCTDWEMKKCNRFGKKHKVGREREREKRKH